MPVTKLCSGTPKWDFLCIGAGGGPMEDDLSAYLVKPHTASWDNALALEGGSCLGALARIAANNPDSLADFELDDSMKPAVKAATIYARLQSYILTHGHMDHLAGLILAAGCSTDRPKNIYGTTHTMRALSTALGGQLWPKLGDYSGQGSCEHVFYKFNEVNPETPFSPVSGIEATVYQVAHGMHKSAKPYDSSAFFITKQATRGQGDSFLFFGDVDADSISKMDLNKQIWQEAARRFIAGKLSTIFIECSWLSSRPFETLYGHLSPPLVMEELRSLAQCVIEAQSITPKPKRTKTNGYTTTPTLAGRLKGINVCITHVKAEISPNDNDKPIVEQIKDELDALEKEARLGVRFVMVEQGMRLAF